METKTAKEESKVEENAVEVEQEMDKEIVKIKISYCKQMIDVIAEVSMTVLKVSLNCFSFQAGRHVTCSKESNRSYDWSSF